MKEIKDDLITWRHTVFMDWKSPQNQDFKSS